MKVRKKRSITISSKSIITIKRVITIISTMNPPNMINMMRDTISIIIRITIRRLMMTTPTTTIIIQVVVLLLPLPLDIRISIIITSRSIDKNNLINQGLVNNSLKIMKRSKIMANRITSLIKMRRIEAIISKSIKNMKIKEIKRSITIRSSKQGIGLSL